LGPFYISPKWNKKTRISWRRMLRPSVKER
jgi:hypothetical protein